MASSLCKIHVNNSTGVSLNERFTAIITKPKVTVGRRSRSRSVERPLQRADNVTSRANQRFLAELQRKHKVQAALKLKRRSMRTIGGGGASGGGSFGRIKRGSVKTLRVGANGKPIRTNSLANIATMNADREALNRRPPLRRSNSSGNLVHRLGPRRPAVGGAAQRIAKRRLDRQRGRGDERGGRFTAVSGRGRPRNRSLTRPQENVRGRSRNRTPNSAPIRGRSRSQNRNPTRGRSRSRGREGNAGRNSLPIKARLGVRPGTTADNRTMHNNRPTQSNNRSPQKNRRGGGNVNNRRNNSITRRGVQSGRVQKRRNSVVKNNVLSNTGANGRNSRPRSRSAIRNNNGNVNGQRQQQQRTPRSRSRTRKGQVGQQTQRGQGQVQQPRRRGRSQQRRGGLNNIQKGSNNTKSNKGSQQQRRGRSRSRTGGRGAGGGGGSRNQGGKQTKPNVNKDELDKELDQYMATTKTENDMDFLLKN